MSEKILYTGRKSLIAYINSIIGTAILVAMINGIFYGISYAMSEAEASENAFNIFSLAWIVVNIYLAASYIYNQFYIRTFQWIVSDEGVRIKSGLLPWKKNDLMNPYEVIFEASYDFGFFAKLFRYGGCNLRRTEGITTELYAPYMHNAAKIIGLINENLKQLRKETRGPKFSATRSDAEELSHLAELKNSGDISAEEFAAMKRKIIER